MEVDNIDLVSFCRGCFSSNKLTKPLNQQPLKDNFVKLTNIKLNNEDDSNLLCLKCLTLLNQLEMFKNKAILVDSIMNKHSIFSKISIEELQKLTVKYKLNNSTMTQNEDITLHACVECDDDIMRNVKVYNFSFENVKKEDSDCENKAPIANNNPKFESIYFENDLDSECESDNEANNKNVDSGTLVPEPDNIIKGKVQKKVKKMSVYCSLDMSKVIVIQIPPEDQLKEMENRRISEDYCCAKYKCEYCVKIFPHSLSLEKHMERHKKSYGVCECEICHQRFSDKRILKNHSAIHTRRYSCRLCGSQFHFKNNLAHHLLRHDNTYVCRICGHHSKDKVSNQLHKKTHSSGETFKCMICSKVISNKHDYNVHLRRHKGDMPFTCNECNKCFQTNATLTAHKAVHSNTRNFYCGICDVSFKTRDIMIAHFKKNSKHIDPNILKFPCDQCSKKFENEAQRDAHVESYHLRHARIACNICSAQFVSANGLRNHRKRIHEGVKPIVSHICETCGRGFSTKALVTNHIRTHTGEKPFQCEKCHKRFSQKSAMQTHYKLVHLKLKRNKAKQQQKLIE